MIRPLTPDDLDDAARIWGRAWHDGHDGHVPEALLTARTPDYFRTQLERWAGDTSVCVEGDAIVGVIVVHGDELEQIGVAPEAQGRGYGELLLAVAEERIAAAYDRAWLAVVPGNTRARRFYEARGWTDAGPRTAQAPTLGADTVAVTIHRYEKDLRHRATPETHAP